MPRLSRTLLASAALCLSVGVLASPAFAATHHKHHHVHHASKVVLSVQAAQRHLSNLGYYTGPVDGKMGPKTRIALKKFQHEHGLKADGKLGPKTTRALDEADKPILHSGMQQIRTSAPVVATESLEDRDIDSDYASSIGKNGTRPVSSRFARIDVSESANGGDKHYNVTLNGQPILLADGQPAVIGISPTYDLGNEDAIIFTTYNAGSTVCTYRHHVLALSNAGQKLLEIDNCTRSYHAQVNDDSLFITFPEHDAARAVGATWRLEGEDLERL